MKKVLALVIVAMMALSMVSAMAATIGSDNAAETGVLETNDNSVQIRKSVVVVNDVAGLTVNYPSITFNYSIATVTPEEGTDVNDGTVTIAVSAGVEGAVTLGSDGVVTIPAGSVTLNESFGKEIVQGLLTINVDPTLFPAAGIYRYKITDTTNTANLTKVGVVRDDDNLDKVYVLDVYIVVDEETHEQKVSGYVLTDEETLHITHEGVGKESGFDEVQTVTTETPYEDYEDIYTEKLGSDVSDEDLQKNDVYYTYNATVNKKVTGSMGDRANNFQFVLTIDNSTAEDTAQTMLYRVNAKEAKTDTDQTVLENPTTVFAKDGETITIYGLNPYATVNYTETNNTVNTYTSVTVNDKADYSNQVKKVEAVAADGTVTAFENGEAVVTWVDAAKATDNDTKTVQFVNELSDISPTGVVLRFAPYVAMLGAGILLVLISRRRKEHEED